MADISTTISYVILDGFFLTSTTLIAPIGLYLLLSVTQKNFCHQGPCTTLPMLIISIKQLQFIMYALLQPAAVNSHSSLLQTILAYTLGTYFAQNQFALNFINNLIAHINMPYTFTQIISIAPLIVEPIIDLITENIYIF